MPLQTFAVFWRNTEKSEAAMSLLWSLEVLLYLIVIENWIVCALKSNFKWVLFLNVGSLAFLWFDVTKGPFTPKVYWWQVWLQRNLVPIFLLGGVRVLLARIQTSTLFICSLKRGVDTEKPRFQKAALNTLGFWISNSFWLDHFSVLLEAPECCTEKLWSVLNWLLLMGILQPFSFFICGLQLLFLDGFRFEIPFKCPVQFFGSRILMNGMATFGWCSTEKPASFTWPSHVWDRVSSFGFVPFYHSEVIPLATVSVRVPFLFPLLPVCFSALLPTYIQLPEEQVARAVLRFMSRLSSSFLMLCNKLLLSNVFVTTLLVLIVDIAHTRMFSLYNPSFKKKCCNEEVGLTTTIYSGITQEAFENLPPCY